MRWMVGLMLGACVDAGPGPCLDTEGARAGVRDGSPAYVGFRWACTNAPACAVVVACAEPRWQRLSPDQLDAAAACMLGPCERRRECLAEVFATCPTQ